MHHKRNSSPIMSAFYDMASMVVLPSGYKSGKIYAQKPLTTDGQLTFTRASNATRVASNGLIEKVRTNLILQSNTFSTTWTNSNSTETSGQAGYDGTNNAWLLSKSASSGYITQSISLSGSQTFSVYAKAGTDNWMVLLITGFSAYYDLQNGVVGTVGAGATATITSVGNGWYRCTIAASATTTSVRIYPAEGNNDTSGTSGNILIQNAQLEVGDIATQYIATNSAAVSVGPVSGLPRLDYLNSSCPRLILEPQRTSNVQFSESFDNAYWAKTNVTLTSTLGGPIDQSKYFTITCNGATGIFKGVGKTFINASANTYTLSVFAKAGTSSSFVVSSRATLTTDNTRAIFNLSNGTITNTNGGTATIVPYGDGWYRCSFTVVNAGTFTNESSIFFGHPFGAANGATVLATGAMSEVGAYATSYIPTLSTSVTRVAESFSKSSISSLIGQTEGTFLVDFVYSNTDISVAQIFSISDSTTANRVYIGTAFGQALIALVTSGGVAQANIPTSFPLVLGQRYRAAIAYKANDFAFYLNGVQIGTDNAGTVPAMNYISNSSGAGSSPANYPLNQLLLFKTRLTNAQLAELTTL
jgi:hypothetical protein